MKNLGGERLGLEIRSKVVFNIIFFYGIETFDVYL